MVTVNTPSKHMPRSDLKTSRSGHNSHTTFFGCGYPVLLSHGCDFSSVKFVSLVNQFVLNRRSRMSSV